MKRTNGLFNRTLGLSNVKCVVAAAALVASALVIGTGVSGASGTIHAGTLNGAPHVVHAHALVGVNIFPTSDGFNTPVGIACDGAHVWVANINSNSVSELLASTGALVQVISGASFGFNKPVAVLSDGTHVWVTNEGGNSVTELSASSGALVRLIKGSNVTIQP